MTTDIRRIAVMGVSGSGKTTFAKALAARLGVAHVDLDGRGAVLRVAAPVSPIARLETSVGGRSGSLAFGRRLRKFDAQWLKGLLVGERDIQRVTVDRPQLVERQADALDRARVFL
jgi:cytidylate kinase